MLSAARLRGFAIVRVYVGADKMAKTRRTTRSLDTDCSITTGRPSRLAHAPVTAPFASTQSQQVSTNVTWQHASAAI